jgi:hypothetical protein
MVLLPAEMAGEGHRRCDGNAEFFVNQNINVILRCKCIAQKQMAPAAFDAHERAPERVRRCNGNEFVPSFPNHSPALVLAVHRGERVIC